MNWNINQEILRLVVGLYRGMKWRKSL